LIGADYNPQLGMHWSGKIDEVRVWNVARSQAEIQAGMNTALTGGEAGLAGSWRFGEGAGATVADQTANHTDGTLGGRRLAFEPAWTAAGAPALGGGLQFDGANDFVLLPPTGLSDFSGGLTLETWANPGAVGSWQRFFDLGNGAPSDNILLARVGTSNDLRLHPYTGGPAVGPGAPPPPPRPERWA